MALPRLEEGIGPIDGSNVDFYVPTPYVAGTVRYWRNGQLLLDDNVLEVNPFTGLIRVSEPPRVGNVVQFFYLDGSSQEGEDIRISCSLSAYLEGYGELSAVLGDNTGISGAVVLEDGLDGYLVPEAPFAVELEGITELQGTLYPCED